jgi:hypothetical protein
VRRPAVALLALAVAGCGGHGHRHPTPTPSAHRAGRLSAPAQLQALLARRARALQAGDPSALTATSVGAQRARDRRAARRARTLRLRAVSIVPLAPGRVGGDAGLSVRVRLTYGLAGAAGTFTATRALRVAHGRISSERPAGARDRLPWDIATFQRRQLHHFLILTPAGLSASGLDAALATGRRQLSSALPGVRVPDRLAVFVAASASQAQLLTRAIRGVESLAAIAEAIVRVRGPAQQVSQVAGQRLIVIWPDYARLDATDRQRVVAHELTHAATARRTSGRTPAWLVEGIALYASGDERADEAGDLLAGRQLAGVGEPGRRAAVGAASLTALARPDAIARRAGVAQAAAYAYASASVFAIAARFGRAGLLRLYDEFSDPALPGRPGPRLQASAIRRALHETQSALSAQIRRYALARAG